MTTPADWKERISDSETVVDTIVDMFAESNIS